MAGRCAQTNRNETYEDTQVVKFFDLEDDNKKLSYEEKCKKKCDADVICKAYEHNLGQDQCTLYFNTHYGQI